MTTTSQQPIEIVSFPVYPFTGVLLDPILAAAAMALSSVTVVSNALRRRRFRPTRLITSANAARPAAVPRPA